MGRVGHDMLRRDMRKVGHLACAPGGEPLLPHRVAGVPAHRAPVRMRVRARQPEQLCHRRCLPPAAPRLQPAYILSSTWGIRMRLHACVCRRHAGTMTCCMRGTHAFVTKCALTSQRTGASRTSCSASMGSSRHVGLRCCFAKPWVRSYISSTAVMGQPSLPVRKAGMFCRTSQQFPTVCMMACSACRSSGPCGVRPAQQPQRRGFLIAAMSHDTARAAT